MYKEKKKNNIFKRIVAFLGATFTAIACFFAFNLNTDHDELNVYADEVITNYSYIGSSFYVPSSIVKFYNGQYGLLNSSVANYTLNISFDLYNNNNNISTTIHSMFFYDSYAVKPKENSYSLTYSLNYQLLNVLFYPTTFPGYDPIYPNILYSDVFYRYSEGFNCNIVKVEFGSYLNLNEIIDETNFKYYNYVKYYDNNDNYIIFAFNVFNNGLFVNYFTFDYPIEDCLFSYRTYFILNNFSNDDYYKQGFADGQIDGYQQGETVGYDNGYDTGFYAGKNEGYNIGKNEVLNNSDIFSFNNLLTSVIDVPVKAFTSLFNFEILGVNLSGFFLGLLTCCIVIGVIRLVL